MNKDVDIVLIGGSSGSMPVLISLIGALPVSLPVPVVIVVHRLKNVQSKLSHILSGERTIFEPEDKEPVKQGQIYLAPQNYHLLIEENKVFSMDYSELVNFSRPSIDVTFKSAAEVYKERTLAILLSGANKDGAEGLDAIIKMGGKALVQDPLTCESPVMPNAAIRMNPNVQILSPELISNLLIAL